MADVVVDTIKRALVPVWAQLAMLPEVTRRVGDIEAHPPLLERLAVAETTLALLPKRETVTIVVDEETKARVGDHARVIGEVTSRVLELESQHQVLERLTAAEARIVALSAAQVEEPDPDEVAKELALMCRKAFGLDALVPAPRMQKRIIRDAAGKVERVVDEPVS